MADENLRQLRVLHVVSNGGVAEGLQQSLLMPLFTRMPKARVKVQVAALAPTAVPGAVLRQQGVPVHDVALSRQRFSMRGFSDLLEAARAFRPDVIQAWGRTAELAATGIAKRCAWKPKVVWSPADTAALPRAPGFIDRRKMKYAAKASSKADRIVYTSEAGASLHRRAGFPEDGYIVVPPGVDATRYKPDFEARRKVREKLQLAHDAIVIGMVAPFRPESDHVSLIKAVGELIKANPHIVLLLAGHGIQKGNAPLMALVGGGTLGARTQLLGEWSDLCSFFNACDIACSSALNDATRMTVVTAMLCGVPCVATGMGAQGEVIGQFGVAIEPGSTTALQRGITRILQMTPEKRAFMAQGARKHALQNYVSVRSLQRYLQLYYDLVGRQSLVTQDVPTPQIDPTVSVPPPLPRDTRPAAKGTVGLAELSDPDSLETQVSAAAVQVTWKAPPKPQQTWQPAPEATSQGDVLETFESKLGKDVSLQSAMMSERARGVAEDTEELLAPEALASPAPKAVRGPSTPPKVTGFATATASGLPSAPVPSTPPSVMPGVAPAISAAAPVGSAPEFSLPTAPVVDASAITPSVSGVTTSTPVGPAPEFSLPTAPVVAASAITPSVTALAPVSSALESPSPTVPVVAASEITPSVSGVMALVSDGPPPALALASTDVPPSMTAVSAGPTEAVAPGLPDASAVTLALVDTPSSNPQPEATIVPPVTSTALRQNTAGLQLDLLDYDEVEQKIAV